MSRQPPPAIDQAGHRALAASLFNRTWTLLDRQDRDAEADTEMVHAAHASAWHWMQAAPGDPLRRSRSEWQCSRVYAVLRQPEPALRHARLALDICERHGIADFDLAFAYEALARACAVSGDRQAASDWTARARLAAAQLADPENRDLLLSDLATIPASP